MGVLFGIVDLSGGGEKEISSLFKNGQEPDSIGPFWVLSSSMTPPGLDTQRAEDERFLVVMDGLITGPTAWIAGSSENGAALLLKAWNKSSATALKQVEGSFSAVVIDKAEVNATLVSDRFGSRPLYYTQKGQKLAFCSYLPGLLSLPWVGRRLRRDCLAEYLSFNAVHPPRTLVESVNQMVAGHHLLFDSDGIAINRYHKMRYCKSGTKPPQTSQLVNTLQSAVANSVERAIAIDHSPALLLSGGLGSTAIAAAAHTLDLHVHSYTIAFEDDPSPETPFAGRVANLLGLDHTTVHISTKEIANSFEKTVSTLGHPLGNPAAMLGAVLLREVGKTHSTVLTGHGTDELFGGAHLLEPAKHLKLLRAANKLPKSLRQRVLTRINNPNNFGFESGIGGAKIFDTDSIRSLLNNKALANPGVRQQVLNPYYQDDQTDPLNRVLNACVGSWLSAERLPRMSRTATAGGLVPLYPLLDPEVVSLATSLPGYSKVKHRRGSLHIRWPLRSMLDGVLPLALLRRPRRGMSAPLDSWLWGTGRLFLEERVEALKSDDRDLFAPEEIDALHHNTPHNANASKCLWNLLILHAWLVEHQIR